MTTTTSTSLENLLRACAQHYARKIANSSRLSEKRLWIIAVRAHGKRFTDLTTIYLNVLVSAQAFCRNARN